MSKILEGLRNEKNHIKGNSLSKLSWTGWSFPFSLVAVQILHTDGFENHTTLFFETDNFQKHRSDPAKFFPFLAICQTALCSPAVTLILTTKTLFIAKASLILLTVTSSNIHSCPQSGAFVDQMEWLTGQPGRGVGEKGLSYQAELSSVLREALCFQASCTLTGSFKEHS